jgi:hypothetical protein
VSEDVFRSFAFKDRISNTECSYSEALDSNVTFEEWRDKTMAEQKLKNVISTYKFTKKFEMNCIRDKYHLTREKDNSYEARVCRRS